MSIWQGILLFIFSSISGIDASAEEFQTHRPIISSTLTGIALGNLKVGIMAGASMELVALGWMTIGAAIPPDPALAGVVVAILAIFGKQSIGVAVGIAITVAVAGELLQMVQKSTIDVAIMHWAERGAQEGKIYRVTAGHLLTAIPSALRVSIPALLIAYFADATIVQNAFNSVPKDITMGLQISTGFLVVVGYAMIMQLLNSKILLPFFFIGFLAMTFTNITLVGLTLLGVSLAIIYYHIITLISATEGKPRRARSADRDEDRESIERNRKTEMEITRKDLLKVFWRSQLFQLSWNYERFQNLCYCYCIMPVLKKLYKTQEELSSAVMMHLEYYNSHPFFASAILGANAAMEETKANGEELDNESITQIKIALMGPLAGIGDPVFWGTIRPVAAAIGAGIASNGNILGPLLFFFVINAVRLFMRYYGLMITYREGINVISKLRNFIPRMKNVMTVLSFTIMGGLVAKWTNINMPVVLYSFNQGGKIVTITIQQQLDAIMPNLLPLILTFAIYWLLKRKVSPLICMIILMLIGIAGYSFGFLR